MADTDLCTLQEAKVYVGLDIEKAVGNIDTLLERLITSVTTAMTMYMGYTQMLAKKYTKSYNGNGSKYLYPYNVPLNSTTSLHISSVWTFDATTLIDSDYYKIVNERYIVYREGIFTLGDQNVQLVYNAGYDPIPTDLTQVCVEEVTNTYNNKGNIGIISRTDSKGGVTKILKGFMPQSIEVMNKYIKVDIY